MIPAKFDSIWPNGCFRTEDWNVKSLRMGGRTDEGRRMMIKPQMDFGQWSNQWNSRMNGLANKYIHC